MAKTIDTTKNQIWGMIAAQGVLAVLAGIAMLFWPGLTLVLLVVLFGIFVLVWGIVNLIRSVLDIGSSPLWWLELLFSVLTVGLGVFLLRNTALAIEVFILLIGFTFILRGVIDLVTAFFTNDEEVREVRSLFIATGLIGVIAGILVLVQPVASGIAFVWVVGLYTILNGSLLVALALKRQSLRTR